MRNKAGEKKSTNKNLNVKQFLKKVFPAIRIRSFDLSMCRESARSCIYEFGQCLCAFLLEIDASENPKKLIRVFFCPISLFLWIQRV